MSVHVSRRAILTALGGTAAAIAVPVASRAQQTPSPAIGILNSRTQGDANDHVTAFRRGLGEVGFVEGQNVQIEYRWAAGNYDRLPALATDLVRRRVAAIFTAGGGASAQIAKAATATIPIVFVAGSDPVATGLVASLNRPGGNITGISLVSSVLQAKRLELLHQFVPTAAVIGALVNPNYPDADLQRRELEEAATKIRRQIHFVNAGTERDIEAAFETLVERKVGSLLIANDPSFATHRDKIVALAVLHHLPVIYSQDDFVMAGGLMSYGSSIADAYRQAGLYIGRILRGEKPADLPIVLPTKFELAINLRAAKTLGLEFPPALLALADAVIE